MTIPSDEEVRRVRHVYQAYSDTGATRRWDPLNRGNRAIRTERERALRQLLLPLAGHVLEIGCGAGGVIGWLAGHASSGQRLHGVDVIIERLASAHQQTPGAAFVAANGNALPYPDSTFRFVIASTLFSSIEDPETISAMVTEIARVLRPDGRLIWYDMRLPNPGNPNVHRLTRQWIARAFRGWDVHLRSITLLPPLARRLGPLTPWLYPALSAVPALRSHYIGWLAPQRIV
jgi:ubiquinone/menaquinone biosynthesis C-methylase UbiE